MLTGLDHVRLAVPSLAAAASACRELGFTVTAEREDDQGTPSQSLMFTHDHIELVQAAPSSEAEPNLAALAVGTRNAGATASAWRRSGLFTTPKTASERTLDGQPDTITSLEVSPTPHEIAGLPILAAAHLTPESLRQPDWLRHPNTATRLATVTVVVADPAACATALDKLFGTAALTWTDRILTVRLGHVAVVLLEPDDLDLLHSGAASPDTNPAIVALGFHVGDLARTARTLTANAKPFSTRPDGSLGIDLDQRIGCLVEFRGER